MAEWIARAADSDVWWSFKSSATTVIAAVVTLLIIVIAFLSPVLAPISARSAPVLTPRFAHPITSSRHRSGSA